MTVQIRRIAICLTDQSFEKLRFLDGPDTLYICDIEPSFAIEGRLIKPNIADYEAAIAYEVRSWFEQLHFELAEEALRGYANNFFETSIVPILSFIFQLESVLDGQLSDSTEVWFTTRYLTKYRTSCYYMAEHESQGLRLYDREAVFTPYLAEYCKSRGINIRYTRISWFGVQPFFNIFRVWLVFVYRFVVELKRTFSAWRKNSKAIGVAPININAAINVLAATRTINQSEAVAGFFALTGLNAVFLAGESFLDNGKNRCYLAEISSKFPNLNFKSLQARSLKFLLKHYLWSAIKILTYTPPDFVFRGQTIATKQSVKELFVMLPELIGYRSALAEAISSIPTPTWKLLISLEQKSPHAYIDAELARNSDLVCVHIMQCDQHARPLPWPVFGDFFLADTESNANRLREIAPESSRRIKYIGSFKACLLSKSDYFDDKLSTREKIRLCFFSHSDNIAANKLVLDFLSRYINKDKFIITIKIHPRDFKSNYRSYSHFQFIANGEMDKQALFDLFEIGISFPSGVINELIFRNKPFVLLGFSAVCNPVIYDYWDDSYYGALTSIGGLSPVLDNYRHLIESFNVYRNSCLVRAGIFSDLNTILSSLKDLVRTD